MLALMCLAVAWACILVPSILRRHREGRPGSSVHSFRRQLSTLERATPGTTLRPMHQGSSTTAPARRSAPARPTAPSHVIKRRRDILVGLLAATGVSFLLVVLASSALTFLLFALCGGSLGAYCYALVQLRMRAEEQATKVRVLRPQTSPYRQTSTVSVRRTANG